MTRSLLILFFVSLAPQGFSQTFSGGFFAGVAGTQVDGDKFAGYNKGGFTVSATAQYPLSPKFLAAIEIGYTGKGAQSKSLISSSGYVPIGTYNLRVNYVDVPLMLKFYDRQRFGLGLGVQYSRLIGSPKQVVYMSPGSTYNLHGLSIVKDNDFGGVAEGSYYFSPLLQFNIRFSYSWIPMGYDQDSDYRNFACFNNVLQFRLGYIWGQTFDEKKKKPNAQQVP